MSYVLVDAALSIALLLGVLACREIGRRLGRRIPADDAVPDEGTAAIQAAVFGLYGLLVAFTFSDATSRFDDRRELVAREAAVVESVGRLVDVLPLQAQPAVRAGLRRYVTARLSAHRAVEDWSTLEGHEAEARDLSRELWRQSVAALRSSPGADGAQPLLQALNEMAAVSASRSAALRRHQPLVVFVLLVAFAFASALTSGYAGAHRGSRRWFHGVLFATVSALSFFVILDLEDPRRGLIRVDDADRALTQALAALEESSR
ncbi:MAG: DUF4239 domain-containing protein [Planctomycetes bacterium]|nr:DUF4239 domain-containing protein [Planctomycetota bacterium]